MGEMPPAIPDLIEEIKNNGLPIETALENNVVEKPLDPSPAEAPAKTPDELIAEALKNYRPQDPPPEFTIQLTKEEKAVRDVIEAFEKQKSAARKKQEERDARRVLPEA